MALTTGKVLCIQVGSDLGATAIEVSTTIRENLFLWATGDRPVDVQVMESNWVSLLRQAMADDVPVTIGHADSSALITSVQLGRF